MKNDSMSDRGSVMGGGGRASIGGGADLLGARRRMIDDMASAIASESDQQNPLGRTYGSRQSSASPSRRSKQDGSQHHAQALTLSGGVAGGTNDIAANPLNSKLQQIENIVEEFFSDRDVQISQREDSQLERRSLQYLVHHMKQIPIVPEQEKEQQVVIHTARGGGKKKGNFQQVFVAIHEQTLDQILLSQDIIVCLLSMAGVMLMVVGSYLGWDSRRPACEIQRVTSRSIDVNATNAFDTAVKDHFDNAVVTLNYLIMFSTLASIGAITNNYRVIIRQKQMEWCKINGQEVIPRNLAYNFWKSSYVFFYALEVIVHIIAPTPWYHSSKDDDYKYLDLWMLFRFYTVLRLLHHLSPLYRSRKEILRSNSELKSSNFQVRFADTMKVYFYTYTWTTGLLLWLFCVLVGGFTVWVAERDSNNGVNVPYPGIEGLGFCTPLDGFYFMVVSVRTIGYGDLKPVTFVGRLATVCFQFFGMSVEALLGSVVIKKIAKTKEEKNIDEYLKSFHAWHELRVASAMLIQATWKSSLRYRYLHHRVGREDMERLLRGMKRHREFLTKISATATTFAMPAYEDLRSEAKSLNTKTTKLRFENEKNLSELGLKQILMHFSNSNTRMNNDVMHRRTKQVNEKGESLAEAAKYSRMPYLRKENVVHDSSDLIEKYSRLFMQDVDLQKFGRNVSNQVPRGFKPVRQFTATKKVVGKYGERRVPVGEGHKADIQQEALKFFRQARQTFKMSVASSSDHVVDTKLYLAYEMLVSASRKIKRNMILLKGLRNVAELELDAVEELLSVAASGGIRK